MGLNLILPILKPYKFDFDTFFQIQKPSNSVQNSISTLTHSLMLHIVYIEHFILNENWSLSKYGVQQLIKINI